MATPSAGDLRNFVIVGHASSGKTTLSEAMLACAGVIGRMGNIAQGSTVSDYHVFLNRMLDVEACHGRLDTAHSTSLRAGLLAASPYVVI